MNPEAGRTPGSAPTASYWCELAWLPPGEARRNVLVNVTGTRVTSVEPDVPNPPPHATRLPGLTLPGFANVHSHAFHRALRGRTESAPTAATTTPTTPGRTRGSFWTWRDQMYALAGRLDPESYGTLARAVYAEMALAGITCVGEFHYLHHGPDGTPYADPNVMTDVLVDAARAAGIRIVLLDTCYLAGGIGRPLTGVQRRFGDGDAYGWAERVDRAAATYAGADDVRVGAAVHSVRAVTPAQMEVVAGWAAVRAAPLHVHLSEQRRENDECRAAYASTPAELLADAGVLGPRTTAVHATHLDDAGIRLLARTDTAVCMCPTTERFLADGIGPAGALSRAGCRLVLGSDSHAVVDLVEEARAMELDERLATRARGHWSAADLIRAMCGAGHGALGYADAGVIAPGAWADLVSVRLDTVRTAGAASDVVRAPEVVVFAATATDIDNVVASGRLVVSGGRHRLVDDVPGLLATAVEALWSPV